MTVASEFDWERLPSEVVRAFARALTGVGRINDAKALATLRSQAPSPDTAFLSPRPIREVVFKGCLPRDPVAFERVYAAATTDSTRQRADLKQARMARLGKQRRTEKLMDAVLDALLAAGRATALPDDNKLMATMHVPTSGGTPYELFPYQREVVDQIRRHAKAKQRPHGLVVMPTGSGKTKTVVRWLVDEQIGAGRKVLWVTHRTELLQQTARTFIEAAPLLKGRLKTMRIRLFGGGYGVPSANAIAERDHEVAIATVPTLNENLPALTAFFRNEDVVVVVDEAHHSTARTWRQIIELARETNDAVLGLTATPTRMAEVDAKALSALFDDTVIARVDMRELITARYLAEPRIARVETRVDMEGDLTSTDLQHLQQYNEISPRMAKRLAEHVGRNSTIVQTWLADRDAYGPTIAFAVNIDHAMTLAEAFQKAGVAADWISHTKGERDAILARFRSGELQVLVNVELLTEGVDLPAVQTVLLCRPTQSEVLLSQMIGRALRGPGVGGTEVAHLVSFHDHWEQFTGWLDPIDLLAPELQPPTPPRAPTTPLEWVEIPRDLIRQAAAEAEERWPAVVGEVYATVPAGWYAFEAEVELPDGETEARRHTVFVAQHQLGGFDDMERAAADGLDTDGFVLQDRFFGTSANPRPPAEQLALLAAYANANGALPPRRSMDARQNVSPRNIAERIVKGDLRPSEARAIISDARDQAPELVDGFWGGQARFTEEVLHVAAFFEAHQAWPIDVERDGPYVRSPDRAEFTWGGAGRDLDAVFDRLAADLTLFEAPLPKPAGGLHWDARATSGAWGLYHPSTKAITVSPVLNSPDAPEFVLDFIVYHELLHHEDCLTGWAGLPHGGDFRARERRHPRHLEADGWLDAFHDRFVADATTRDSL